jgi:hypothetical protein
MASHYERLICVNSRHADTSASTRVPPDVHAAALDALKAPGWSLFEFLRACLFTLVRKPEETIAFVRDGYTPKKVGRPRKATPPTE